MNRTTAPGSVGGFYVDDDPGTSTQGTLIVAADKNMTQEEIANAVEGMGLTLNSGADDQLLTGLRAASNTVNADKLDGQHGSYYQDAANLNAGIIADARMPNLTGDVTTTEGAVATTITNSAVTDAKLRNSGALSVIGRSANSAGAPADISAANDNEVLRRSGTDLAFGTIATGGITNSAVTDAKLRNSGALSVIGRSANSAGAPADILTSADGDVLRRSGTILGFGTISNSSTDNTINSSESVQTTGNARTHTIASMVVGEVKSLAIDLVNTNGSTQTLSVVLPASGYYSYHLFTPGQFVIGSQQSSSSPAHTYASRMIGGTTVYTSSINTNNTLQVHGTITRVA